MSASSAATHIFAADPEADARSSTAPPRTVADAAATSSAERASTKMPPAVASELAALPAPAKDVMAALRPCHVSEVVAAVGQPGCDVSIQYEVDSGFAAAMASVMACTAMLREGAPRPQALLWEFDWHDAGRALEPAEDVVAALRAVAVRLASGGQLDDALARALWREMNRLPSLWSDGGSVSAGGFGPGAGGNGGTKGRAGKGGGARPRSVCERLPGLEQLRKCVRTVAALAAPSARG
mmetsp:Transcript_64658/g.179860  ORF Transcript_64658/g.179860 Transcript_64658/m.179860 type:complete len:239 (-) Transcript_64658:332-1048(-)